MEISRMKRLINETEMSNGERAYLSYVNTIFVEYKTLVGSTCLSELVKTGQLNDLLPDIVKRLSEDTKDKIYKFFEDVVNSLRHPNSPAPPALKASLDQALMEVSPVLPDFSYWRDIADEDQLRKFDRTFNPATRLFHCEYDLLFVAKTGLLVTYWGPLFALIAGPPATPAHEHLLGLL